MTMLSPEASSRVDAIFDQVDPIERDRPWGRPLLIPTPEIAANPMVPWPSNRKPHPQGRLPYTRASTMGDYVGDHSALEVWRARSLAKGLGEREDLAALAAGLPAIIANRKNKDTLTRHEREIDKATNAQLDWIIDEAQKHANRDYKANWGTAIHTFTDPGDHGEIPDRMRADVDAFRRLVARWEIIATEIFCVNDRYQSAGSFDHLARVPADSLPEWVTGSPIFVVDKKTGLLHEDSMPIQQAVYAGGEVYDPYTDQRSPLESLTEGEEVNRDWAIILHLPLGMGMAQAYFVDLRGGREGAELACQVRAYRQRKDLLLPHNFVETERLVVAGKIAASTTMAELVEVRNEAIKDGLWVPDLEALAKQQRAALTSN